MRQLTSLGFLAALSLAAIFPIPAFPQEVPLEVRGDGVQRVFLVNQFPVVIEAPNKDAAYFWGVPPSVTTLNKGNTLVITSAPKGDHVITVQSLTVDWEGKRFNPVRVGTIQFTVGNVPPGPNPPPGPQPPPPGPDDVLTKTITAAFATEPDPAKKQHAKLLADVYAHAQGRIRDTSTWGVFTAAIQKESARIGAAGKLLTTQRAIAQYLVREIPSSAMADNPISPDDREKAGALLTQITTILENLAR